MRQGAERRTKSIAKTTDIRPDKLKVLCYGNSGSKKTWFAGTFPSPYFFDTDNGMLTLRDVEGVEYDTYEDIDQKKPAAWLAIEKKLGELQQDCPFETVVVDSITTVSDLMMNSILQLNGRAGGTPQLQDWLQQMNKIKSFILNVKALPCHVVFVAHEQVEKDENTGRIKMLPYVTGKLAGKIGLYFDEMLHAEVLQKGKDSEFRLLTRSSGIYDAKSRLGCFDQYEEPDFKKLMEKVHAQKD